MLRADWAIIGGPQVGKISRVAVSGSTRLAAFRPAAFRATRSKFDSASIVVWTHQFQNRFGVYECGHKSDFGKIDLVKTGPE